MLRSLNTLVYAAFCALGLALCARPALLWAKSLGLLHPVLAWTVPLGALQALLAAALVVLLVRALHVGLWGARALRAERVATLLCAGAALALRAAVAEPVAPRDPAPVLLGALETVATALDHAWSGRYAPPTVELREDAGFRLHGRPLRLHVVPVLGARGAQWVAEPGAIAVAISPDGQRAWLSVQSLDGPLVLHGRPVVLQARAGTHAPPGRDPGLPPYPGAQPLAR